MFGGNYNAEAQRRRQILNIIELYKVYTANIFRPLN